MKLSVSIFLGYVSLFFREQISRDPAVPMKRSTVSEQRSREGAHRNVRRKLFWGGRLLFILFIASKSGSDGFWRLTKPMRFPSVR